MVTVYANSKSSRMVISSYLAIRKQNELRHERKVETSDELTVEGICKFMEERKFEMDFSVSGLKKFLADEKVRDTELIKAVSKRLFIVQCLRDEKFDTDQGITYTIKQINHEVVDLMIRFLHGKRNFSSNQISRMLNLSDQKSYTATSKWDSEIASKKKLMRGREDVRPNMFAPIPESINLEIDRLIEEGKKGDKAIAVLTGVSLTSVQNRRSRKNERETVEIMEKVLKKSKTEEMGPSDVFGIAMFPKKKGADSAKEAVRVE